MIIFKFELLLLLLLLLLLTYFCICWQRIKGYQQLQAHFQNELDEELREKPNDVKKSRIRKKVRFNLDVIVYEPISNYDMEDQSVSLVYAPERVVPSFPASYRYNNCYGDGNNYDNDEDEDGECELSDIEDDDDDNVVSGSETADCRPLIGFADTGLRTSCDKTIYGRPRRHYAVPVLNPIENLSQWKAVKARKF
ncbi:hypothetical protein RND81_12G136100 [Saponaria officinalis]|uniref:Uncharacterized protein n=1 Tax=Saponaria officinalis TaxID=3572 RepID=A0AAW1HA63_SAPOF